DRTHEPAAAGRPLEPRGRHARQRHRPSAPGGRPGKAGAGALYLHQGQPHRTLSPERAWHRIGRLVSGQLPQKVRSPGVHGRADPGPPLASPARNPQLMAKAASTRLILASGSPARRDLLTQAGYSFEVMPAHIDEPDGTGATDPRAYVHQVAW